MKLMIVRIMRLKDNNWRSITPPTTHTHTHTCTHTHTYTLAHIFICMFKQCIFGQQLFINACLVKRNTWPTPSSFELCCKISTNTSIANINFI